jgi:hypothetical protein
MAVPEVETLLQFYEGSYATCVRSFARSEPHTPERSEHLIDFIHLQYVRTEAAAKRRAHLFSEGAELAFEHAPTQRPSVPSTKQNPYNSFKLVGEIRHLLHDLKLVIVKNRTKIDFLTCDDPAVFLNRLYSQRRTLFPGGAGLCNAGAMFLLPLTPRETAIVYDTDAYYFPNSAAGYCDVFDEDDILSLNLFKQ